MSLSRKIDKLFSEIARRQKDESLLPTHGYRNLFSNPGRAYRAYVKFIEPWFYRYLTGPTERWCHASLTRHLREHCLLYDDLMSERDPVVERALTIMAPDLATARFRRLARGMHISMLRIHPTLEEQNYDPFVPYMAPYIEEAKFQLQEEEELLGYHPTDRRLYCGGTTGMGEFEPGMHFLVSIPNVYGAAIGNIHKK